MITRDVTSFRPERILRRIKTCTNLGKRLRPNSVRFMNTNGFPGLCRKVTAVTTKDGDVLLANTIKPGELSTSGKQTRMGAIVCHYLQLECKCERAPPAAAQSAAGSAAALYLIEFRSLKGNRSISVSRERGKYIRSVSPICVRSFPPMRGIGKNRFGL